MCMCVCMCVCARVFKCDAIIEMEIKVLNIRAMKKEKRLKVCFNTIHSMTSDLVCYIIAFSSAFYFYNYTIKKGNQIKYNKDMYTENDYVAISHHEEAIYTMQPSLKYASITLGS